MNLWSRLGLSVGVIALYCITMTEILQDKHYYELYRWHLCGFLLASGALLWLVSLARKASRRSTQKKAAPDESADSEPAPGLLASILNPGYWGPMLVVFGVIVFFIVPMPKTLTVAARSPTNSTARPEPPKPRPWPALFIQGVVFKQPNPSVMINGKTHFIGDEIEGARLVEIGSDRAVLEWQGERKTLVIGTKTRP